MLDLGDLLVRKLLEMGEVEAEALVGDIGSFLLHMGAEDLAQGAVHQMRAAVVVGDALPSGGIDNKLESSRAVLRQALGDMDREVVLLDGVEYADALAVLALEESGVSDLTAHLSVERSTVEHELEHFLVLLDDGALLEQESSVHLGGVEADELDFLAAMVLHPVAESIGGGVAGALLLLAELLLESVHVDRKSVFGRDELG